MIIKGKYVKIGSMPTCKIQFRYNYKMEVGKKVLFKEKGHVGKYQKGKIWAINDNCIFIEL